MKLLIALMFVSGVCFGQVGDTILVHGNDKLIAVKKLSSTDSLDLKVFSTRDVREYVGKIYDTVKSQKVLKYIGAKQHDELVAVLNEILADADKKRKQK